jgi:hypothetical protein
MGLSAQQILGNDPEYLQRQLAQQEIQKYQNFQNPQLGLAATSGALLGRGIANLFQGRGFFEVSDPALRRVSEVNSIISQGLQGIDPTDPTASANAYASIARQLAAAGYAQPAALAAAEASKMTATLEGGKKVSSTYQLKGGGALYEKAGRLYKMDDTPVTSNEVEVIVKPNPLDALLKPPAGAAAAGDKKAAPKGDKKPISGFDPNAAPTPPANAPAASDSVIAPATSAESFAKGEAAAEAQKKALRKAERAAMEPKPVDETPAPKEKKTTKSKSKLPTDDEIEQGDWIVTDPDGAALIEKEQAEILSGKRKTYSDKARSFFERA